MNSKLLNAFYALRQKFGSHSAAAQALSLNRDHYCAIRNGRVHIPQRTADYIILKASELEADSSPMPVARAKS